MERQGLEPLLGTLKKLNLRLPMIESTANDIPDLDLNAMAT